jgi:hypothetical protein
MKSLVEQWSTSGMSQSEFAREHSIKTRTFQYWKRKYHQKAEAPPAFIQLQGTNPSMIHICYPSGIEVELTEQYPVDKLKLLLQM